MYGGLIKGVFLASTKFYCKSDKEVKEGAKLLWVSCVFVNGIVLCGDDKVAALNYT